MANNAGLDGFEIIVGGPFALSSSEPGMLTWIAKAGRYHLGSVRLECNERHTIVLRDLQIPSPESRERTQTVARLLAAVADYAKAHGVLKLKVHRNSASEEIGKWLTRLGFTDAARPGKLQFYLDLYRPSRRRRAAHHAQQHTPTPPALPC